jgi:hypothetical protein
MRRTVPARPPTRTPLPAADPTVVDTTHRAAVASPDEDVALVDLLDRVLARGVVVSGEITLTVADVDLVHLSLRALLSAVRPDLFTSGPGSDIGGPA